MGLIHKNVTLLNRLSFPTFNIKIKALNRKSFSPPGISPNPNKKQSQIAAVIPKARQAQEPVIQKFSKKYNYKLPTSNKNLNSGAVSQSQKFPLLTPTKK